MKPTHTPNLKILFALTLIHFTGDFYSAFTTPLFPAFMEKLDRIKRPHVVRLSERVRQMLGTGEGR